MLNYKVMKVGFGRNNPDLSCFHLISKSDRHSAPHRPAAFPAAPAEFLSSGIRQGTNNARRGCVSGCPPEQAVLTLSHMQDGLHTLLSTHTPRSVPTHTKPGPASSCACLGVAHPELPQMGSHRTVSSTFEMFS